MTYIVRRTAGKNHYYVDLDIGTRGERIPGVTTIVKAMANKKLENHGVGAAADYAVNNWDQLSDMPPADRVKAIMRGRWESLDEAGNKGKAIHRYGEQLLVGKTVDIPNGLRKYVDSYVSFMDVSGIQADRIEVPCYSASHRYAGTIDIIGSLILPEDPEWDDVPRDDDGRSYGVLDPKSGRGVYETAALQLCAYANAEHLITEGAASSDRDKRVEIPMPHVDFAAAVHIHPDGSTATLIRTRCGPGTFRKFLYLAQVYELSQTSSELLHPPTPYEATSSYRLVREDTP